MKRSPLVLGATAVSVAAVLSFRTHPLSTSTVSSGTPSAIAGGTATTAPAATTPSTTTPASPATASSSASAASTSTTTTTTPTTATATGTAEVTRYGVVQVRVTETAGRISNVATVELTADDPHSQEINSEAVPQLRAQALSAQGAEIDGVSGATFTTQGYEASLQSALDKLGFKG